MTAQTFDKARHGLHALPPAPAWAQGATPLRDAEFLLDLVRANAPVTTIELGVAAGVSSAYLLYALDTLPDVADGRLHRPEEHIATPLPQEPTEQRSPR